MNSSCEPAAAAWGEPSARTLSLFQRPRNRQPYPTQSRRRISLPVSGSEISEWRIGRATYFSP